MSARRIHKCSVIWLGVGVLCLGSGLFNVSWRFNLVAFGLLCFIVAGVWGRR